MMHDEEIASSPLYQTLDSKDVTYTVDSPPSTGNNSVGHDTNDRIDVKCLDPTTPSTNNSSTLFQSEFPACCRPPSSVSDMFLQSTTYYPSQSRSVLIELLLCILFYFTAHRIPTTVFGMSVNQRPIPYQITAAGDVILDMYINHSVVDRETVTEAMLNVIVVLIPVLVWYLAAFLCGVKHDAHALGCAYLLTLGSTEATTTFFKLYLGYLRPNFYDLCGFNPNSLSCEGDKHDVHQARLSSPSGHSSTSFAAMGILSLFFLGKIGLHRGMVGYGNLLRSYGGSTDNLVCVPSIKKKLLAIMAVSPLILATFVAASRVHDNYHHPADVVAGSLIGVTCAAFSYALWYPSIYTSFAGFPLQAIHDMMKEQVNRRPSY